MSLTLNNPPPCDEVTRRVFQVSGNSPLTVSSKNCMVWKILIYSLVPQTVKIGTTPGGDDILLEDTLIANEWKVVTKDITPSNDLPIVLHLSGFTAYAKIIVYKLKL